MIICHIILGGITMKTSFGTLPSGEQASLYTISCEKLTAQISDFGATLVRLYVPDRDGNLADVVLGYDDVNEYAARSGHLGAPVGRNANRIGGASFSLNGKTVQLGVNNNKNNLHSGPNFFDQRMWQVEVYESDRIVLRLDSPDGDQGFPGNAVIRVSYILEGTSLKLCYDAVCDQDTVFNMTNHTYFNLAGHNNPVLAMEQTLMMPSEVFTVADAESIPTGELRKVNGTPFDFRTAKPIGRDIVADYEPLNLQSGYDHNFDASISPCAVLRDPASGRTMEVYTDCPGVQFYSGNYLNNPGKDGVFYAKRSGICLETQFYPDSVNHPEWPQPFTPANTPYHSETEYKFC